METFKYRAYDSSGNAVEGEIQGVNQSAAQESIVSQGLHPVSIKKKHENSFKLNFRRSGKLTLDELEFVTAELSLLLKSGVKIDRCLTILARGNTSSATGKLLNELSQAVKRGESLADALGAQAGFDELYVNLVKMGEASGQLDSVFAGLARDLKFRKELKGKITQALIYPAVIFFVCLVAVLFVFNFIVPQMAGLFADSDTLPFYTEMLINTATWMQNYQIALFVGLVVFGLLVRWALAKGLINDWLDETLLKLPLFRSAVAQVERIRFNTSMSLMLNAGVRVDEAIHLAAGSVKNNIIKRSIQGARAKIKRGESLSGSLSGNPIYPDFYVSLLEIGEESGELAPVFEEIAGRSRDSFGNWTSRLTSLLEPIMILFMGVIVGGVVVVMLLSIISVNDGF